VVHGASEFTRDIDLLVLVDADNLARLRAAAPRPRLHRMSSNADPSERRSSDATSESRARASSNAAEMRIGYRMMGVAFQVTSEVAAGVFIGWFIDWMRGGGTMGMIIGGSIGVAVAMFTLIRQGLRVTKELDEIDRRKRSGS